MKFLEKRTTLRLRYNQIFGKFISRISVSFPIFSVEWVTSRKFSNFRTYCKFFQGIFVPFVPVSQLSVISFSQFTDECFSGRRKKMNFSREHVVPRGRPLTVFGAYLQPLFNGHTDRFILTFFDISAFHTNVFQHLFRFEIARLSGKHT